MKLLRTICVVGLALSVATGAYAATQSIKLSGDITIRTFARGEYDLTKHQEPIIPAQPDIDERHMDALYGTNNWQTWFMSTAEVQLDADLTDNVSGVIRLFNQRDWDVRTKEGDADTKRTDNLYRATNTPLYPEEAYPDLREFDVGLDLAYIELKEFLYSPLTLKIGRQDLWFGRGFVVGANMRDYNNLINADEYTCMRSFDAIRATLDYDPWTIDAFAAMIWENEIGSKDDETLWGINVGYLLDMYNAELEAYWFNKTDRGTVPPRDLKQHNYVHTVGARGSADPLEYITVAGEAAYQFGHFVGFRNQLEVRNRSAWAVDGSVECSYLKEIMPWKPIVGAEYILYTGDKTPYLSGQTTGTYTGWDYMYRGKFDTAYREYVGRYNFTHMGWLISRNTEYRIAMNTQIDDSRDNQHQVLVYGNVMPTDSITVDGKLGFFWQQHYREIDPNILTYNQPAIMGQTNRRLATFLGTEFDLGVTWDYTEDVSFGLLAAWFFPGSFYDDQSDSTATDLVGTVKLSF
ncbi:MAG: alginate export family protein [Candidatus Omnitrophota bacterium]